MTEMQKLDILLKHAKVPHTYDRDFLSASNKIGEQIIVCDSEGHRLWDGICCDGSYGGKQGLIEVMGTQLVGHDDLEGWLTARQVMKMWRCRKYDAKNR